MKCRLIRPIVHEQIVKISVSIPNNKRTWIILVLDQGMRVDDQSKKADKQLIKTLSQGIKANRQKYTAMAKEVKKG